MHSFGYHKLPIRWPNHVQPQELPASALLPCPCVVRGTTKRVPLLPDVANPQNVPQERRRETGKTIIDKWWMVHVTNTNKKQQIQCGLSWIAWNILGNFYSLVHEERAFWRAKLHMPYASFELVLLKTSHQLTWWKNGFQSSMTCQNWVYCCLS